MTYNDDESDDDDDDDEVCVCDNSSVTSDIKQTGSVNCSHIQC